MNKFILPALTLAAAVAVTGTGCSGGAGSVVPPAPAPPVQPTRFAQSSLARTTAPQSSDADVAAVVAGNTDFAFKALNLLDPGAGANTVFSPYSLTLAVAMAAAGAKGDTLAGIDQAFSISLPQERFMPAVNKLDLALAAETTGTSQSGEPLPKLNIVNALWAQQGYSLMPAYLDAVASNYGAGVHLVDYVNAAETARGSINDWVAAQTNQRITNLLAPGTVDASTRLVLTNAIWFKGRWALPFDTLATRPQAFYDRNGNSSSVPFMHQSLTLSYAQGANYQAVDLPYSDGKLSMLLVMPTGVSMDAFLSTLTPASLSAITGALGTQRVALALPKFTFSSAADFTSLLGKMGMATAFSPISADFSGIDGTHSLHISDVVHKAYISVDETGTEAAAATGVIVSVTSVAPGLETPMTLDHPFLFLIRDRSSGAVLFVGKLMLPVQG